MRTYRHLDLVMAAFVAVLLISNIASSAKIIDSGLSIFGLPLSFDAGTILFPLSYIFGDILTEVYGYAQSRRVIWVGLGASFVMSFIFFIIQLLPGELSWEQSVGDHAFASILGGVSDFGIVIASLSAYFIGEFSNSYVLAKMKVWTAGRWLWMRTISSTIVGEGLDTIVFILVACSLSVFSWSLALSLIVANFIYKVGIEILFTPVTYLIVGILKIIEHEDYYDSDTDFNPFHV